jgi:peptide/nickel transport system permease protein
MPLHEARRDSRPLVWQIVRALLHLLACILIAGFAATALVVFSPGYGIDETLLDPRYSSALDPQVQDRDAGRLYWEYLVALSRGDLGVSSSFNEPVSVLLAGRIGVTARNVGLGLLLAWAGALLLSVCGLLPWGRRLRPTAVATGSFLLCIPSALIALIAVLLNLSAAPAIAAVVLPRVHRYTDNLLQAAAGRAHVVAARARGVHLWRLISSHVIRTAFPEIAALAGVSMNIALGACIPMEVLADDPGVGQLAWRGALSRDVQLVAGATLLIAIVTMTANRISMTAVTLARRSS